MSAISSRYVSKLNSPCCTCAVLLIKRKYEESTKVNGPSVNFRILKGGSIKLLVSSYSSGKLKLRTTTTTMPANAPILGQFDQDPRVHFDKTAGTWQYEDEESGTEYEWNGKVWIPVVSRV